MPRAHGELAQLPRLPRRPSRGSLLPLGHAASAHKPAGLNGGSNSIEPIATPAPAAATPPAPPITGLRQRVLARLFLQAQQGFDVSQLHFFGAADDAAGPLDPGSTASVRHSLSTAEIFAGAPQDAASPRPGCGRAAVAAAMRAFHRKRNVLEQMVIEAVHALDDTHIALMLGFEGDAAGTMLALYNWREARVTCVQPVYSRRAMACIMWCVQPLATQRVVDLVCSVRSERVSKVMCALQEHRAAPQQPPLLPVAPVARAAHRDGAARARARGRAIRRSCSGALQVAPWPQAHALARVATRRRPRALRVVR